MAFLSPLPGAGGGSNFLASPTKMLTSPLGLGLPSPAEPKNSPPHFAVKEGRLSLERLLDEASDSQNSSQEEALDVFASRPAALAKANSAKQLDVFAGQPAHTRNPSDAASNATVAEVEAAAEAGALADSLTAKLQEQLMPWLKQQVQEALAGGSLVLPPEVAGMDAKLQAALCQQDIMHRAASSIAEALPSVLAKQLQSSQEPSPSMEGSICATKTLQHSTLPNPAAMPAVTSATSDSSGQENNPANTTMQQTTSISYHAQPYIPYIASAPIEAAQQAADHEDDSERPVKRVCIALDLPTRCSPSAVPALQSRPLSTSWDLELNMASPAEEEAPASGGSEPRKRRTHYVKMWELETSIQEAQVVAQHLRQAVAQAEAQHTSIVEENRQLWNAVAHLNASLHAGHAVMLEAALAAMAPPLLLPQEQQLSPGSELMESEAEDPTSAPATATAVAGITPSLTDMFGASPDPMALAEACGMLFSPAPAKLPRDAAAAGNHENKPRKLFEEEVAFCGGGKAPTAAGPVLQAQAQ